MDRGHESHTRDVIRCNIAGLVLVHDSTIRVQWCIMWGIVLSEMLYPAGCQMDRANEEVATETKANDFAMDGTFMCGEREHHKSSLGQVIIVLSSSWSKDS